MFNLSLNLQKIIVYYKIILKTRKYLNTYLIILSTYVQNSKKILITFNNNNTIK